VKSRPASFAAIAATVFAGTILIGASAILIATAIVAPPASRLSLYVVGAIGGGWSMMLVLFSAASVIILGVRQRNRELRSLRAFGAARLQVRALVLGEAVLVAALSAAAACVPAAVGGGLLLGLVQQLGEVTAELQLLPVVIALAATTVFMVVIVAAGSWVGVGMAHPRRSAQHTGKGRGRALASGILVALAVAFSVMTLVFHAISGDPYDVMMMAGNACIAASIGISLLAPATLSRVTALAHRRVRGGWAGLALFTTARRAEILGYALGPTVVMVGVTVGTLFLVDIDTRSLADHGGSDDVVNLVNLLIAVAIAAFTTAVVVNAWASLASHRKSEFTAMRLAGATRGQLRASLAMEGAITALVGTALGLLASLTTVLPFSLARGEGLIPDGGLWIALAVVAFALVVGSAASQITAGPLRVDVRPTRSAN
jgi:putative ABC transport system permease protein